ncbi:acetyl-CoA synthetase-like protein [Panus rudis PR-1116 ss-1]|nr:acetyl-CoA synthetase-like protein [Panus rudis PR-1116 ss-1]
MTTSTQRSFAGCKIRISCPEITILLTALLPSIRTGDDILCAPGMPHEVETRLVDGRVQRVYKNLWPSVRDFWLECARLHGDKTYIVFEGNRYSYADILSRSLKAAVALRDVFRVQKGDRVVICSHNHSEYLVIFWACHLLGAVTVLVNAWLPSDPLVHCIQHSRCKVLFADAERAALLDHAVSQLRASGTAGCLVLDENSAVATLRGAFRSWAAVQPPCEVDDKSVIASDPGIEPEDNCIIIFTSGTTGLPKGVLSTQRQFLTNVRNMTIGSSRATLRAGGTLAGPYVGPQKGMLVAVPLFHVSGSTSFSMMATASGMKIVLAKKWDINKGILSLVVGLMKQENIRAGGGVPAMIYDLIEAPLSGHPLEFFLFGGSSSPSFLPGRAKQVFPEATITHAFGCTETNAVAVALAGRDYELRPTSAGIPCPVNEILIVRNDKVVPHDVPGEIWLKGPNVMKFATSKALTKDGWFKTGDLGYLDKEGFLYIKDRIKDLIIRGGENIDSVSVEEAIYADDRVAQVAAVGIPDTRLGELVAAVVSVKPRYWGTVRERQIIDRCKESLPRFAVPAMVIIQDTPLELTPSGKIMKSPLRELARKEWSRRSTAVMGAVSSPSSRL